MIEPMPVMGLRMRLTVLLLGNLMGSFIDG